jgi:hypothetical protein
VADQQQQLDELLNSVSDLSDRVGALAGQIELANDFLRQDLDSGSSAAFAEASRALSEARSLDAKAVTREELERKERLRAETDRRQARSRSVKLVAATVLLTVLFGVLGWAIGSVHKTTDQLGRVFNTFTVTAYDACTRRNQRTVLLTQTFKQLLATEQQEQTAAPSPLHVSRIVAYQSALNDLSPLDDCTIYQRLSLDNTSGQ